MSRLCIAANVKDEQFIIADWCEAHRYADELLIVDTGSGDDTIAIAQQSGAHIRHADINEGYGVVRTACITFAAELGCEWAMILDADERVLRWAPELQLEELPSDGIDMTTQWPAGPGAPTHCKYNAIRTGRMIHQEGIIRGAIEDEHIIAYQMRRRHWFDLNMLQPCQSWVGEQGGIDDWQHRFCRTDGRVAYTRMVHEMLKRVSDGGPPEPSGAFGPEGPVIDHHHVAYKRLTPGRAEEVSALSNRLYEADDEHRGVTY